MFIKLTVTADGAEHAFIDAARIEAVHSDSRPTSILTHSGARWLVRETPGQVLALVRLAQSQAHPTKEVIGVEDL